MDRYLRIEDVPEQWRQQFKRALMGSAQPVIDGEGACAHAKIAKAQPMATSASLRMAYFLSKLTAGALEISASLATVKLGLTA